MTYLVHVSSLSTPGNAGIRRVMSAWREMPFRLVFPWTFALAAFASWTILFPHRSSAFVASGLPADSPDMYGVSTFHCLQLRPDWAPSLNRPPR